MRHLPQPVRSGGFSAYRVVRRAAVHQTVSAAARAKYEREVAAQVVPAEVETYVGEIRES
jgi:hypothetical protein